MPKTYEVSYWELWQGFKLATDAETMYCNFGVRGLITDDPVVAQGFCDDLCDASAGVFSTILGSDWTLGNSFVLQGLYTAGTVNTPPARWLQSTAPIAGILPSGGSVPQNTAVLFHKHTVTGRSGRAFIPGVLEVNLSTNGALDVTALGNWGVVASDLRVALLGVTGVDILAYQRKAGDTTPFTSAIEVTGFIVDPVVATQRRRLRR